MIQKILSISGRPGLFKLVNQGRNMLIVESLADGKRTPAYSHDKVVAIADISIYTNDDEERPLVKVLETIRDKNEAKPVDVKGIGSDADLRKYFESILPEFDKERVYTNDIRKVFNWYNCLIAAGITDFSLPEPDNAGEEESEKEA